MDRNWIWIYRSHERGEIVNIWVEWFRFEDTNNTWAQIRELPKWNPPPSTEIQRRFFDKHEDPAEFAKRKNDEGYHATIKTDKGR